MDHCDEVPHKGFGEEDVPDTDTPDTENFIHETDDEGIDCNSGEEDVDDSDSDNEGDSKRERIDENSAKEEQYHRKKKKKKQKKRKSKRNKDGLFSRGLQFLGLRKKTKKQKL